MMLIWENKLSATDVTRMKTCNMLHVGQWHNHVCPCCEKQEKPLFGTKIRVTQKKPEPKPDKAAVVWLEEVRKIEDLGYPESRRSNQEEGCPIPELKDVEKVIADGCGGLPLAIVVISGLLAKFDMTREFWQFVAENESIDVSLVLDGLLAIPQVCNVCENTYPHLRLRLVALKTLLLDFFISRGNPLVLPYEIWEMPQLRHVVVRRAELLDPVKKDSTILESLQTISYKGNFREDRVPLSLKKLNLSWCRIPWENMTMVGSLPNLEVLKLMYHACEGSEWNPVEGGFRRLKVLLIRYIDLEWWRAENIHFPSLKRLLLKEVFYLKEIPSGIGDIATLQSIDLNSCDFRLSNRQANTGGTTELGK
ncbi:Disease resistance protein RGA5 [Sesamum angolense]|uniref:Disease resistance protein RGA5 n=1 Tax=Sesamum angolense TaxID=2727404 RepID=A0AAE2BR43_9LAMI|nr:Disease resistance protein RGA5 [Sesamum angolense]